MILFKIHFLTYHANGKKMLEICHIIPLVGILQLISNNPYSGFLHRQLNFDVILSIGLVKKKFWKRLVDSFHRSMVIHIP